MEGVCVSTHDAFVVHDVAILPGGRHSDMLQTNFWYEWTAVAGIYGGDVTRAISARTHTSTQMFAR